MSALDLLSYAALGAAAGTTAGLLGVGGGVIVVPGLALLLGDGAVPADRLMQFAVASSLANLVVTSLSSVRTHHRRGAVHWPVVARMSPGIAAGAVAGAAIASILPTRTLALLFGGFLIVAALRIALSGHPAAHRQLPRAPALAGCGGVLGTLSSLLGIGGGALTVPLLAWCNVPLRQAVATSAACGLPIALASAAAFAIAGSAGPDVPMATGYLYWPAIAALAPTSVLFAPVGAWLAHTVPVALLQRGFAAFIMVVGIRMVIG